jgi:tight adherence protein C
VTLLLLASLALVGISSILVLRLATFGRVRRSRTLAQIDAYGFESATAANESRGLGDVVRAVATALGTGLLVRIGPERERALRSILDSAGFYRTRTATFLGARALAAAGLPFVALALAAASGGIGARMVLGGLFLGAAGWILPKFVLERRGRARLEQVDREVPELVDLLGTTVEAGVGFAAALQLAARSIRGPLGEELRLALHEQSMGLTTDEALRNMAGRIDSPAVRQFVQALRQGEALGVSIGKILRDLAVDMRLRRRQAAEERAQKAPTKILFPLVVLILPAMFIVTLGPVVVQIMRVLGAS